MDFFLIPYHEYDDDYHTFRHLRLFLVSSFYQTTDRPGSADEQMQHSTKDPTLKRLPAFPSDARVITECFTPYPFWVVIWRFAHFFLFFLFAFYCISLSASLFSFRPRLRRRWRREQTAAGERPGIGCRLADLVSWRMG